MPSWWGKSSSKDEKKKANKESFIDTLHRKFRIISEDRSSGRSRGSRRRCDDIVPGRGALSRVPSRSPSPSTEVSRCQSFAERSHALPLPLPTVHPPIVSRTDSGINASKGPGLNRSSKPSFVPLPKPQSAASRIDYTGTEADLATASVSSGSSVGDNPSDSLPSPLASDCENGNRAAVGNSSRDQSPHGHKYSAELLMPVPVLSNKTQILSTSPKRRPLGSHVQNLQIPRRDILCSAPDSLLSSPSRSPMRSCVPDQVSNHGLLFGKPYSDVSLLGSGQCSSPGSGYNSGNNSIGGDMSGQLFWLQSRCSPECSPVPSPRMTSPGPSSRIHSGTVTPLHPRAGGSTTGSPTRRLDDSKQQSHRLPLPPLTISNTCPFSPTYSAATSPSVPRSPARAEAIVSPGSRWKKGRLLGRGSFGHVYLGFNSESGEMCAMKEVTLCPDDPKSKECAQQLGQEIALLSRLRHPNIVQYYGSETVDDKLYIYLEFVSGGSIYKLLQEYGQFGGNAIRNYTHQILSGLAYLHGKKTVHRDIKGANILVDPHGRVKLADFGMAKHITAQSGPLSFKGSPYWMAPEVIKNSSGSNLARDIWSLGCTVLEMATTKPPWSQYEGVPAMFKIGNSKELPEIPDHLSEEGKDFVRQCLQRNPANRPSAAELLEHPFVRNAGQPLERPITSAEPAETTMPMASNATRSEDMATARSLPCLLDSEDATNLQPKSLKPGSVFSASHSPRNSSCPISPIESLILHARSPQHISGRRSPSPISSPHCVSGSSTPLTGGGNGAIPFHHQRQIVTNYVHEGIGSSRSPGNNCFYGNSNMFQDLRHDNISRGNTRTQPHVFWENNGSIQPSYEWNNLKDSQPVLSDHVSQQLLSEHLKLKTLDLRSGFLIPGPTNGGT
ncbi:PREDICTED: mitogen-activated protein kinase kinase kinase YODA-like [Tarenaya hassleriana]|uniref:mitogen-activated protein kinase kinase kinase YODA-like n=1 Tax=Tarenaya hassleriana TaxID=28532 RepID=UPI00053C0DD6|nr:PREDICTED: mitogen-activated protein kinase kinase kinase YODA-like [Tarenaya hassleriana]XP_010545665.1 PREDICTED: mitogen-activated protein kinase kinase kinase YODA-like [Tarenaya hassleriana]